MRTMKFPEWLRTSTVLILFTVIFLSLTQHSISSMSATSDEPVHITTGFMSLKVGDHRFDPEHPPFLRDWAAFPLLFHDNMRWTTADIDNLTPPKWIAETQAFYSFLFVYRANATDDVIDPGRFMISLFGVLLGILIFFWARELFGFWPAVFALAFFTFEPNLQAHASLVTTDFGVTCFFFGAIYFTWRVTRNLSFANFAGLLAFTVLAVISKYSSFLLAPLIVLLLAIHSLRAIPWRSSIGPWKTIETPLRKLAASTVIVLTLFLVSWAAIWASYGFRYLPSDNPGWHFEFEVVPGAREMAPTVTPIVHWIDSHHLFPNAFSQGFLLQQAKEKGRYTYFLGRNTVTAWWYYFPVAFLIKTPISLILLLAAGLVLCCKRWKEFRQNYIFVLLPVVIFMAVAMHSQINIGLRHILPIYPFVILIAALAASQLLRLKPKIAFSVLGLLCAFWCFEFLRVYPDNLAFFNEFIGGPQNGYKYLSDSNLDWGQDLKSLKLWMDEHGVPSINYVVFGPADPAYYGIQANYIPGSPSFAYSQVRAPQLPGYVAVSPMIYMGTITGAQEKEYFRPLFAREPTAIINNSIRIYWADRPWWTIKP
jgi:Dolichyl-phosphate-mannose-protein mannosyltransferase